MGENDDHNSVGMLFDRRFWRRAPGAYLAAVALPVVAFAVRMIFASALGSFPFITFFPAVLVAAYLGGWAPGVVATLVSEALSVFFLIEPASSIASSPASDVAGLAFFSIVCGMIILLMQMLRNTTQRLQATSDALQRTNDLLEQRVVERTGALADANAALRAEIGARQEAEAQMLQAQKLEALGQLAGGLAHDFNNMLQAVSGSLDLMRRRLAQGRPEQVERYIEAAAHSTGRAALLTERLLAFARRQTLVPVRVEANKLVLEMEERIRRAIGSEIDVVVQLGESVWPVLCDPTQLESALMNLALNGRDAMPNGGILRLVTRNLRLPGAEAERREGLGAGMYVEVAVTDTGTGMTEDVLAHAFEPFFTTKPIGKGTGLGLSQLYGFVRQSHGEVRIESAPGEGTTVRLFLPRSAEVVRTDPAAPSRTAAGVSSETVLLVEDEEVVRQMASEALRELGCSVLEAADGPEALRILDRIGAPDLLVTDVGLPGGINGRQLADAVRERLPNLPVLLITGYAGGALEEQLAPGMEVMTKPFRLDALVTAVKRMAHPISAQPD